jgi:hypothetical protein
MKTTKVLAAIGTACAILFSPVALAQTNKPYWLVDKPRFTLDATVVSVSPSSIVLTNYVPVAKYSDPILDPHGAGSYRVLQPGRYLGTVMEERTYNLKFYPFVTSVQKGTSIHCADCWIYSESAGLITLNYWRDPNRSPSNTVYITDIDPQRYHRASCGHLQHHSTRPVALTDAVSNRYTPCLDCKPPPLSNNSSQRQVDRSNHR